MEARCGFALARLGEKVGDNFLHAVRRIGVTAGDEKGSGVDRFKIDLLW